MAAVMGKMTSLMSKLAYAVAAASGMYMLAIATLTIPYVQRNAFYANKANPTWIQDLSDVEQFGFLHHQVQPFTLVTPDNVTLYCWHILPTHLYLEHEAALQSQPDFGLKSAADAAQSVNFQLLQNDPSAEVVVSFHGNAAHIASAWRPMTQRAILGLSTPSRPVHVVTLDYRGFGLSTGSPSETGVITDTLTLASFLTGLAAPSHPSPLTPSSLSIAPSHITLFGQSLGTATATALYHSWALTHGLPPFRALILLASFASLPSVLDSYSAKGLTPPMLGPLKFFPGFKSWVKDSVVDKWETSRRLADLVSDPAVPLDVTLLHAHNDGDIPWREGWRNWEAAMAATNGSGTLVCGMHTEGEGQREVRVWESDDLRKRVRWEKVRHGGHNRVATSEQAKLAVLRSLNASP